MLQPWNTSNSNKCLLPPLELTSEAASKLKPGKSSSYLKDFKMVIMISWIVMRLFSFKPSSPKMLKESVSIHGNVQILDSN